MFPFHFYAADLSQMLTDDDPTYGALTCAATAATAWPQIHHGELLLYYKSL